MKRIALTMAGLVFTASSSAQVFEFRQSIKGLKPDSPVQMCSSMPDDFRGFCGGPSGAEAHVKIGGEVFAIDNSIHAEAFSCAVGRYASDAEAQELASFLGFPIYTPWGSWLAFSTAVSRDAALGVSRSVGPDGERHSNIPYLSFRSFGPASGNFGMRNLGTANDLVPPTRASAQGMIAYSPSELDMNPGISRRACRL